MGRTDAEAEAEAPILWPPDMKSRLIGKDPDAGNDWGQQEKGATEDEMVSLISHTSKVMLNILQARLQQYLNWEFSDVHAGLEKAEEPEIKLLTCLGS